MPATVETDDKMPDISGFNMTMDDIFTPEEADAMNAAYNASKKALADLKESYRLRLKNLINTRILWRWLNEGNEFWEPMGIYKLKIQYKHNHYYNRMMPHAEVIGDTVLPEMHWQEEYQKEVGANHIFVRQYGGDYGCEDCYHGHLAIPLSDRTYFLISYSG